MHDDLFRSRMRIDKSGHIYCCMCMLCGVSVGASTSLHVLLLAERQHRCKQQSTLRNGNEHTRALLQRRRSHLGRLATYAQ